MLALKGNQGTFRDDVEEFLIEQKYNEYNDFQPSRHQTLEKSHGRIEPQTVTVTADIDWLKERHPWAGLASIVLVESCREIGARTEREDSVPRRGVRTPTFGKAQVLIRTPRRAT